MNSYISHSKPTITSKDQDAILQVVQSNMIDRGKKVVEFESSVADYLGLKGGVATSSGTSALYLSLKALNVRKGDEVILPTYVCYTVLSAVQRTGATPVLCDVGDKWVISYDSVSPHITSKTKAIIAPHIGGIAIRVKPLTELGVPVIEDLAQAFGAKIDNQKVGTFGKITMCSFKAIKCLTTGEGGMILCNDKDVLENVKSMQIFSSMSDIQASLGISQLKQYESFLQRRREIADFYFKEFSKISNIHMLLSRDRSMFFRFPVVTSLSFEMLKSKFEKKGIAVRQFIDFLLHRILKQSSRNFPKAEEHFEKTLSIPIYPSLNNNQVKYIVSTGVEILSEI